MISLLLQHMKYIVNLLKTKIIILIYSTSTGFTFLAFCVQSFVGYLHINGKSTIHLKSKDKTSLINSGNKFCQETMEEWHKIELNSKVKDIWK